MEDHNAGHGNDPSELPGCVAGTHWGDHPSALAAWGLPGCAKNHAIRREQPYLRRKPPMPSGRSGRGAARSARSGAEAPRSSMAEWIREGPDHQLSHAVRTRDGAQARRRGPRDLRRRRLLAVVGEPLEIPGGRLRLPLAAPRHGGLPRRARADRPGARDRRDRADLRRELLHLDPDRTAEPLHQGLRIAFPHAGPPPRQGCIRETGHQAGTSGPRDGPGDLRDELRMPPAASESTSPAPPSRAAGSAA